MEQNNQKPITEVSNVDASPVGQKPPIPAPKKSKLKIPILVAALMVLFIIAYFGYLTLDSMGLNPLNPKPKAMVPFHEVINTTPDLTNWKTYTNFQHGFLIKYPNEWAVNNDLGDGSIPSIYNPQNPIQNVVFKIIDNSQNLPIKQLIEQSIPIGFTPVYSTINTDSYSVTSTKIPNQQGCTDEDVFIVGDKIVYQLQNSCSKTPSDIFDQILSTFKFTDDSSKYANLNCKTDNDCTLIKPSNVCDRYCLNVSGESIAASQSWVSDQQINCPALNPLVAVSCAARSDHKDVIPKCINLKCQRVLSDSY